MRQAGTIATKQNAERFANYLLSQGITAKLEPDDGQWAVWIHDENAIPRSKEELEQFQREPDDRRYVDAEHAARAARREATEKKRQAQRNYVDLRNQWANPWRRQPVTMGMIIVCIALALGIAGSNTANLLFSWPAIQSGQVWRLVTPVFLHAPLSTAPQHLVFNMLMLYSLGTLVERRLGPFYFVLLVLAVAVVSNFTQFSVRGPNFVGMSGVVYGLFGYAWVRGRLEPTSGLYLQASLVYVMIGWFILCAAGVIGNVANWAHGGGMVMGALLAYVPYQLRPRR